jgi:hypothetical protein
MTLCGLPTTAIDVLIVATPLLDAPVPIEDPSTTNVTVVFAGVPVAGDTGAIVAVSVTVWPETDGFAEEVTVVVVLAAVTSCKDPVEVLAA